MRYGSVIPLWFRLSLAILCICAMSESADIAIYGDLDPAPVQALGHTTTILSLSDIEAGSMSGADVLLLGHIVGESAWSEAACSSVEAYLNGGGHLITEWNAVDILFGQSGSNTWQAVSPQCGFFEGTIDGGDVVAFATELDFTDRLSPLLSGLAGGPDPGFDLGDGSESLVTVSGFDTSLWVSPLDFGGVPGMGEALLAGHDPGGGWVVAAPIDLFDAFGWGGTREEDARTLLQNMINVAQWPECQPDGSSPIDASDLAVELRVLSEPGYSSAGPSDCIPAGDTNADDLQWLISSIFAS